MMTYEEIAQDVLRREIMKHLTTMWDSGHNRALDLVEGELLESEVLEARAEQISEATHQVLHLLGRNSGAL